VLVGWQWMIDSRFNVAVAFEVLYNLKHHPTLFTVDGKPLGSAFEPDGYVRIGFAL
jgi:hypothetical protein